MHRITKLAAGVSGLIWKFSSQKAQKDGLRFDLKERMQLAHRSMQNKDTGRTMITMSTPAAWLD